MEWNEAPLMLSLNCDLFNKILIEATVYNYFTDTTEIISCIGFCLSQSNSEKILTFKTEPEIVMFYIYQTGIQRKAIDLMME